MPASSRWIGLELLRRLGRRAQRSRSELAVLGLRLDRLVRALVDDDDVVVLVDHPRERGRRAAEHADRLDLLGERDHVERDELARGVAEAAEVIEIARERVGIARDVDEDGQQ